MAHTPDDLSDDALLFLSERHLATLSLVSADGSVHVTPVGFTWDNEAQVARVISFAQAKKVRLIDAGGPLIAALSQVDGGRWFTLYGTATVTADAVVNADAERRYAARYRPPSNRGVDRRTIEMAVNKIVGRC
ncbi:MAG: pyridoxamine 5'-phosphate oxidase family protein [Acidimicrobiales bacterium]